MQSQQLAQSKYLLFCPLEDFTYYGVHPEIDWTNKSSKSMVAPVKSYELIGSLNQNELKALSSFPLEVDSMDVFCLKIEFESLVDGCYCPMRLLLTNQEIWFVSQGHIEGLGSDELKRVIEQFEHCPPTELRMASNG